MALLRRFFENQVEEVPMLSAGERQSLLLGFSKHVDSVASCQSPRLAKRVEDQWPLSDPFIAAAEQLPREVATGNEGLTDVLPDPGKLTARAEREREAGVDQVCLRESEVFHARCLKGQRPTKERGDAFSKEFYGLGLLIGCDHTPATTKQFQCVRARPAPYLDSHPRPPRFPSLPFELLESSEEQLTRRAICAPAIVPRANWRRPIPSGPVPTWVGQVVSAD